MRAIVLSRCVAAATLGLAGQAAAAEEVNSTSVDLTAGAGYSTNPFVGGKGGSGSAFARLAAMLSHHWSSERTSTAVTAYWEGSEYFNYRMTNLLAISGQTAHAVNERLDLTAAGRLAADFSGELANRFLDVVPPGQPDTGPALPGVPEDAYLYGGRQYRANGEVGLSWRASERSRIVGSVGASRAVFSQSGLADHTTEDASIGYQRSLSEQTDVGLRLTATGTQFGGSGNSTFIMGPAATIHTHISQEWTLAGSVGVTFSKVRHGVHDSHSADPSLSASLCHDNVTLRLCANVGHYTHSSAVAQLITATTAGLDLVKLLDNKQTIEVSAAYMRYSNAQGQIASIRPDQYRAAASYSRLLNDRLSVGASASARGFGGAASSGSRESDLSGTVFLRYRWGNRG